MSKIIEPRLPSEMFIRIPADRGGRKPFILGFLEQLPTSLEAFEGTKIKTAHASQIRTCHTNDVLDFDT